MNKATKNVDIREEIAAHPSDYMNTWNLITIHLVELERAYKREDEKEIGRVKDLIKRDRVETFEEYVTRKHSPERVERILARIGERRKEEVNQIAHEYNALPAEKRFDRKYVFSLGDRVGQIIWEK